ncbi:bifunctional lysine ketoglutarate reductase /saccharopine dehydrogenase family protein [Bacteroidota bacterium]
MEKCIGIRREDKNKWERRVPLTPAHVQELKSIFGITTQIQPFPTRAFSDQEYEEAGAIVTEDLSKCPAVFAVKEIPIDFLLPDKTYIFFSHTIKSQEYNMPLLQKIIDLNCTLIDYECIKEESGRRLVFFGVYAGIAGMIETLHGMGIKYKKMGVDTPFLKVMQPYEYKNVEHAKQEIKKIGEEIKENGLPQELLPFTIGFTGYGNVSNGAQEIFDLLPHEMITPDKLKNLSSDNQNLIYKVVFKEEHMFEPVDKNADFELQDYFDHPEKYKSKFGTYIPNLDVLVNCIFWHDKCPKLVTKKFLSNNPDIKLKMVGDISCDVNGAIEFVSKITTPDQPALTFDVKTGQIFDGYEGSGPSVIAIDNLPCELPVDSSNGFSEALHSLVPLIVDIDLNKSFDELELPHEIKNAIIVYKGELTPNFCYLKKSLES